MNTPVRSPRLPAEQRRQSLIDAFIDEALAANSIAGAGIRGVVERAGCTAPVVYRLFGDRTGLVRAVVRSTHAPMIERLEAVSKLPGASTADRLRALVERTLSRPQGRSEAFESLVAAECRRDPRVARLVRDVFGRFEARLVEMLREGVEGGELRSDLDLAYVAWRIIDLGLLRSQLFLMRLARPERLDYLSRAMESLIAEIRAPDPAHGRPR
ncbi:MAG: TetR/AcrR family transcriptional regulator [Myxococcota bacterium]